MTKRFGFTLAEVLITLGIIGVVAAMTIPTLVKNYQKTVWVNQLKKSVSILEQGFQKMLADDGVDKLWDTEFWNLVINKNQYETGASLINHNEILKKYFNIIKSFDEGTYSKNTLGFGYKTLDGKNTYNGCEDAIQIYLADGSLLGLFAHGHGQIYNPTTKHYDIEITDVAVVTMDVNGDKGPNQWGRDTFYFVLDEKAQLIPIGSKRCQDDQSLFECSSADDCLTTGSTCAARIIENGWKMDY